MMGDKKADGPAHVIRQQYNNQPAQRREQKECLKWKFHYTADPFDDLTQQTDGQQVQADHQDRD